LKSNSSVYVIQRVDGDWASLNRDVFSPNEIAYIAVLLALYAIGLMFAVWKLGRNLYFKGVLGSAYEMEPWGVIIDRLLIVMLLILVFFIFRVVLFALLVSGALYDTTSPGVDWVLIEWPIVMYFCYATNYVLIWLTVVKISQMLSTNVPQMFELANIATIVLNILVIIMFIIFIILYSTIVGVPKILCGGNYVQFDFDTAHKLILAYRITFGSIDIVLGIFLLFAGIAFMNVMNKSKKDLKTKRMIVLAAAVFGSLGLFAQGVAWITITSLNTTISNYVSLSILLFVEILPSLFFLAMIAEKSSTGTSYKSRSRGSRTGGSDASTAAPSSTSSRA